MTGVAEVLKHICQQRHIKLEIEVMIIPKVLTLCRLPNRLRMLVVFIRAGLIFKIVMKGLLRWKAINRKLLIAINPAVWIDSLLFKEIQIDTGFNRKRLRLSKLVSG